MTRGFFDRYSRSLHEKFGNFGAQFAELSDEPTQLFEEHGFYVQSRTSIVARGSTSRGSRIASKLIGTFAKSLAYGYAIYEFQAPDRDGE